MKFAPSSGDASLRRIERSRSIEIDRAIFLFGILIEKNSHSARAWYGFQGGFILFNCFGSQPSWSWIDIGQIEYRGEARCLIYCDAEFLRPRLSRWFDVARISEKLLIFRSIDTIYAMMEWKIFVEPRSSQTNFFFVHLFLSFSFLSQSPFSILAICMR